MHYRFLPLFVSLFISFSTFAQSYDLVIKNGRVIDGTGNPWVYADIAVQNGRIAQIGTVNSADAKRIIDATGLVVAPGFIDVHTHVETSLEAQLGAPNFVHDGVTTIITGNCGSSRINLRTYFDTLRVKGVSVNVGSLIGHNTVRVKVMKMVFREPTAREQADMETLVEQAMKEGAVGLSTGLIYTPGTYAKTTEVVNLAKMASRYGGLYASHIRTEGQNVKTAIEEAIQISREGPDSGRNITL